MSRQLAVSCFLAAIFRVFYGYNDAYIELTPRVAETPLNKTVTFTCLATNATIINIAVNGNSSLPPDAEWKEEEHICTETISSGLPAEYRRKKVSFKALFRYDEAEINCLAYGNGTFKNATSQLKIQGLLASVGDLTATPLDSSSVQLTWTPPDTLDNVPIIGYYIDIIKSNVSSTNAIITLTDPDPCTLTTVSVTPINGAGKGESASVSFQFDTVQEVSSQIVKFRPFVSESGKIHVDLIFEMVIQHVHSITIGEQTYKKDKITRCDDRSVITIHESIYTNPRCFSLNFDGDITENYIVDIPSVDYQSQCISCTFYTSGSTDQGCQVNLTKNGEILYSVEFLRHPLTSLSAGGCIPFHAANIGCYDIYIYTIRKDGSPSSQPIQILLQSDPNCEIPNQNKDCASSLCWISYIFIALSGAANIALIVIIILILTSERCREAITGFFTCTRQAQFSMKK